MEHNESTLDDNPFRYCGEYYDKETKTIYLRARYYNAEQGRFTQEDPIRDGYNWYAYCENNPIMFVDPTGQWAWLSKAVAIATTVAVAAIAVTAIVATAGAAAPAIGIGVGMAFGCSGAVASAVTTSATVGAYAVAGTIGAIAVSDSIEIATSDESGYGYNPIRDSVMGGNQEAYDTLKIATDIVADCIVEVGASNYVYNSSTNYEEANKSEPLYYQVTSSQAAQKIAETGKLYPSAIEQSVCVLDHQPTLKEATQLGAYSVETVIAFSTNCKTFVPDTTVSSKGAYRNYRNGMIEVYNVREVNFK